MTRTNEQWNEWQDSPKEMLVTTQQFYQQVKSSNIKNKDKEELLSFFEWGISQLKEDIEIEKRCM